MLIYRVECQDGFGVYTYLLNWDDETDTTFYGKHLDKDYIRLRNPPPESDGISIENIINHFGWRYENTLFAFESVNQLNDWFPIEIRQKIQQEIETPMRISIYSVSNDDVYRGCKQICFNKSKASFFGVIDFLTLERHDENQNSNRYPFLVYSEEQPGSKTAISTDVSEAYNETYQNLQKKAA